MHMNDATKIRAEARRRLASAQRTLAAAKAGFEAQAQRVELMRRRGEDAALADVLLGNLREILASRQEQFDRAAAAVTELEATPDWKLNRAGARDEEPS